MKVTFGTEEYQCTKAQKNGDKVVLALEEGGVAEFSGVKDVEGFILEGGEWSQPEVTPEEQLRADVDFIAAMTGVMLA